MGIKPTTLLRNELLLLICKCDPAQSSVPRSSLKNKGKYMQFYTAGVRDLVNTR